MKKIIKKHSIETLKRVASLPALVTDEIELTPVGDYYVAPSPFAPLSPMTLCVNPAANKFRCTASGKHGDAIDYLRSRYGLPFVSAVELLAKRFGFKLEYEAAAPLDFPQVELPLEAA